MQCHKCLNDAVGVMQYYYHDGSSFGVDLVCAEHKFEQPNDVVWDEQGFSIYRPDPCFFANCYSESDIAHRASSATQEYREEQWFTEGVGCGIYDAGRIFHAKLAIDK